jgi:hypothetical protein
LTKKPKSLPTGINEPFGSGTDAEAATDGVLPSVMHQNITRMLDYWHGKMGADKALPSRSNIDLMDFHDISGHVVLIEIVRSDGNTIPLSSRLR